MKKLAVTLCAVALASGAFAQGVVNFANAAGTSFRTNGTAAGQTLGNAAGAIGSFYYEVLVAPSTITTVDSSLQALLSAPWSDTALRGTNTAIAGRASAGSGVTVQNWDAGVARSFIIVGWSANEGNSWAEVASKLAGASLQSGQWVGGGLVNGGFLGASTIQAGASGGGASGLPAFSLFGATGSAQGTPISTTTDMFIVNIPEPTSMALVGLGLGALVIFRRRK